MSYQYCIIREGINTHTLCRGNPLFMEVWDTTCDKWIDEDLGGIYSGDVTHKMITEELAMRIVKGRLTETEAYRDSRCHN